MLIAAAPYRISFAGGGTDIPFFYQRCEGAVLSVAINKFVYVSIHPYYRRDQSLVKYSMTESVGRVDEIRHPLFREALRMAQIESGVEISSTADIPSRTGMGSSSTFSVALLHALWAYSSRELSKSELAELACELEIGRLNDPIGKQDQYAAAFGGFNLLTFRPDGSVDVSPVKATQEVREALEERLLLLYLSDQRNSRDVLRDQTRSVSADDGKFEKMQAMARLAHEMRELLVRGDLARFAEMMHQGWLLKRELSSRITNEKIDYYYERGREAGAKGGRLLGAGGGGFLLFYVEPEKRAAVRLALADLLELPFRFEYEGSRVVHAGDGGPREGFVYRRPPSDD